MSYYYIQDTRTYVGNSVVWWREAGEGYTSELDEAGKFSEEEAREICRRRSTDIAFPCAAINARATRHVDSQRLRTVKSLAEKDAAS